MRLLEPVDGCYILAIGLSALKTRRHISNLMNKVVVKVGEVVIKLSSCLWGQSLGHLAKWLPTFLGSWKMPILRFHLFIDSRKITTILL